MSYLGIETSSEISLYLIYIKRCTNKKHRHIHDMHAKTYRCIIIIFNTNQTSEIIVITSFIIVALCFILVQKKSSEIDP